MALFTVGSLNIEAALYPPPKGWACSAATVFRVYIKFLFCGCRPFAGGQRQPLIYLLLNLVMYILITCVKVNKGKIYLEKI